MKLTVLNSNLKQGLENVSYGITTTGTLPILSHILLEAKKSGLEITSTNLELGIKVKVRAKVDKPGKVVVPFKIIYDFIINNLDEKINFELDKNNLKISTNHFKADILTINPEEFPILPSVQNAEKIILKKKDFLNGIQKVIIAPTVDEIKPVLSGVLFWFQKNQLILVGTDGFRLAEQKIKQVKNNKESKNILPLKIVQVALRILSKSLLDTFFIYFSENQLKFEIGDATIIGRLIEGEYPDYTQIIPKDFSTRLLLNKSEFERALRILSAFSQEANRQVKIEVKKDKLLIKANSPQIGSNEATIDANIEGSPASINFNSLYLLEGLSVIEEEELVFDLTGDLSPGVLKGKDNESFTYLVMPLRED